MAPAPGIGIDLIEIERLERALERRPGLLERLFRADEIEACATRARPGRHLAARFAAKEAALKALGIGACGCARSRSSAGTSFRHAWSCTRASPRRPARRGSSSRSRSATRASSQPRSWSPSARADPQVRGADYPALGMPDWLEPLHDAASMRATDAWAIEQQGVPSLELMEAAGRAVAEAALGLARPGRHGPCAARGTTGVTESSPRATLPPPGYECEVMLIAPPGELSADARANLERFEGP